MNVTDQFRDVMHRTMTNLEIIERMVRELPREDQKPFEVTQLVNSVMGAVAWPRERQLGTKLRPIPIARAVQEYRLPDMVDEYPDHPSGPNKERYKPKDLDKLMTLLRHGFAHGNFRFNPGHDGQVESVHVWNVLPDNHRQAGEKTWGTTLSIDQLRQLLHSFVLLADHLYAQQPHVKEAES